MQLKPGKKIYFASDFHLGVPSYEVSLAREKKIVAWLTEAQKDAQEIFLVGDIFDFWFEYKHAIPRGYTRFLGKIVELVDAGISVHFFTGNHDMWMFDYLETELGVTIHRDKITREFNNKKFLIAHGDGLGPGDHGYKFLKKALRNKFLQWCFARLHPNFGIGLANWFSRKSRKHTEKDVFLGEDKEWLITYCKRKLTQDNFNYFIFGHRHYPIDFKINETAHYVNLGEWLNSCTYAVFDGEKLQLKEFKL